MLENTLPNPSNNITAKLLQRTDKLFAWLLKYLKKL